MNHDFMSPLRTPERPGVLAEIDAYWRSRCDEALLPRRTDIDPVELGAALGSISLIDILHDPLRFRFRLVASNIQARFKQNLTGTYIHEFPEADNARLFEAVYRVVLKTREPQTYNGTIFEKLEERLCRATIWPLASDRQTIDGLLCCREPIKDPAGLTPDSAEDWLARAR